MVRSGRQSHLDREMYVRPGCGDRFITELQLRRGMNGDDTRMSGVLAVFFASAVILVLSQYVIVPLRSAADWFLLPVSWHNAAVRPLSHSKQADTWPFITMHFIKMYSWPTKAVWSNSTERKQKRSCQISLLFQSWGWFECISRAAEVRLWCGNDRLSFGSTCCF